MLPRKPKQLDTSRQVDIDTVKDVSKQKGTSVKVACITSSLQVDLEGDGQDEVIIYATSPDFNELIYKKGDYSLVVLRKLVKGKVQTFLLTGQFNTDSEKKHPAGELYLPQIFRPVGMFDVDGDGALEILVGWTCHRADSGGFEIYGLCSRKTQAAAACYRL